MSGNNHIPEFTATDIEKYLKGQLTPAEMHTIERAALDDPFLADAIEGMALHAELPGQPSFTADLQNLQSRLEHQITADDKKPKIFYLTRAAAAVIIIAGLALIARQTFSSRNMGPATVAHAASREFAKSDSVTAPTIQPQTEKASGNWADSASVSQIGDASDNLALTQTESPKLVAPKTSLSRSRKTTKILPAGQSADYYSYAQPGQAISPAQDFSSADSTYDQKATIQTDTIGYKNPSLTFKDQLSKNQSITTYNFKKTSNNVQGFATFSYNGRVTDQNNNGLPGASVFLKSANNISRNISATTDQSGFFNFQLPKTDSTSTDRVVVQSNGYEDASFAMTDDNRLRTGNILQLKPQSHSLNEIVVVGYGAKRKETIRRDIDRETLPLSTTAIPTAGWDSYNQYIKQNKRITGLDSTLIGKEVISFIVNEKGKLSSFKIEQSISPEHDAEATRLIKQGPAWKLIKGRRTRAVVIITFP